MEDYIITRRRFLQNSATVCSTFLIPQLAAFGGREPVADENPWRTRTRGGRESYRPFWSDDGCPYGLKSSKMINQTTLRYNKSIHG